MRLAQQLNACTDRFCKALGFHNAEVATDARVLVRAAFFLYHDEWSGPGKRFDIRQWQWPFEELQAVDAFTGNEPWSVLFRKAWIMADRITPAALLAEHR